MYEVLESERQRIVEYALKHPEVRHRELAWKTVDEGVCAVSSSTVYRVLREAGLVCRWKPKVKARGSGKPAPPGKPDELWQTDIRYTKVGKRNYYLLSFLDVYSRYVAYHELLPWMDGLTVSVAAALETLPQEVRPTIQSDHGSAFVAKEFAGTLAESGVGHTSPLRYHPGSRTAILPDLERRPGRRFGVGGQRATAHRGWHRSWHPGLVLAPGSSGCRPEPDRCHGLCAGTPSGSARLTEHRPWV